MNVETERHLVIAQTAATIEGPFLVLVGIDTTLINEETSCLDTP